MLGIASVLPLLLGLFAFVPVASLATFGAIGPLTTGIAMPNYTVAIGQLGSLELLQTYRMEADAAITPRAAGEALHALSLVGALPREGDAREMRRFIPNPDLPRPVRWDAFTEFVTVDGCLGAGRVVFGPTAEHELWLARVREALVRYPADAERFDHVVTYGHFGRDPAPQRNTLERALSAAIGRPEGVQGCSEIIAGWSRYAQAPHPPKCKRAGARRRCALPHRPGR